MNLGLRDRVQAVIFSYEAGLVRPGPPDCHPGRSLRLPVVPGFIVAIAYLVAVRPALVRAQRVETA